LPAELRSATPAGASVPGTIQPVSSIVLVCSGAGEGLRLEFIQMEGRKRVTAREFVNGTRLRPGERFDG
jgi:methionyl-tRNA formyltransferase